MPKKAKKEKIEEKNGKEFELTKITDFSSSAKNVRREEESELEEDIEKAEEEIDDSRFVEFLQPIKSRAPVLGRNLPLEELPDFGVELLESVGFEKKKEDDKEGFKYLAGAENKEEPKYIDMGGEHIAGTSRVEIIGLGRGSLFEKQNVFFKPSELGIEQSQNLEKYTSPDRFDIEKAGKGNPFEKRDVKYKPSR